MKVKRGTSKAGLASWAANTVCFSSLTRNFFARSMFYGANGPEARISGSSTFSDRSLRPRGSYQAQGEDGTDRIQQSYGEGVPGNEGVVVKLETANQGMTSRRQIALAVGLGILMMIGALISSAGIAKANDSSYPVRLCSPERFDGNGYPYGTFNSSLGTGTRVFYKAANGNITYDTMSLGQSTWTLWDPALRCNTANSSGSQLGDYGIRFFNDDTGLISKGEEGGLEFVAPAGTEIQQLSMKGRALRANDPAGNQGGISNGGTQLKEDFIQPQGQTPVAVPNQTYQAVSIGASVAQNASKVRLSLVCNPGNGATVCIGGIGQTVLLNDLVLTLGDLVKPTVTIGSSPLTTEGQWVSGTATLNYTAQDSQSGLRETSVYIDNNLVDEKTYPCNLVIGTGSGDYDKYMGKTQQPCPLTPQTESVSIDTTRFGDGLHTLKVCARDFARSTSYWKDGPEKGTNSCSNDKTIRIDNTAPAAPEQAEAINTRIPRSVNPYDVSWTDPGTGDNGSPIHEVRYEVVNQAGNEVVSTTSVDNGSGSNDPASQPAADNIEDIPYLQTPLASGEFKLQMRLVDEVGHVSKATDVPLSYSCMNSGGDPLPQANIAMGLIEPGQATEAATEFLALDQGDDSTVVGKVRGPGQMPVNGADLCINAKPVVDPQLQVLNEVETNGNGNYSSELTPGPSRNLLTVFRQGHRETWSDPVSTQVTVAPTLSSTLKGGDSKWYKNQKRAYVRTGKIAWFRGSIPGPYNDKVVVVLQGKAANQSDNQYRAFRRYRTRNGGKYQMRNIFYNNSTTGKKAYLKVRVQVRNQSGYPYSQGDSKAMTLVVLPKKKHNKKK